MRCNKVHLFSEIFRDIITVIVEEVFRPGIHFPMRMFFKFSHTLRE